MLFLYPAFLFALASLLIPVLVHLFNFRRYQKVYFSNVQFLKDVQEQQSSRKNLKERLILAARLLALAFLVLAFAKPYLPGVNAANAGKQHIVSIFVDNSYSMQTLNREGSLLDEAKRRAKEIASVYSINDRFQLLTQDFEGKHQRLLSRDEFNDAVDTVKISAQSRSLQQIINRQQRLLDMNRDKQRSVYVISDFQKNMGNGLVKADTGLHIDLVQLKASTLPNVAVDSVNLLSAIHRPGDAEKLILRLHNYSDERAEKIPLKLRINGVEKAIGSYTVKPRSVQFDTLSFSGLQAGWQRAEISLQDNPVTFDNQFYFSFNVKPRFELMLIDGGIPNPFLKAAFEADPFFNAKRVPEGNVDYAALNTYPLVVLSDINAISTGLSQQLKTYVSKGGTLLIFPATITDLPNYQSFLKSVNAAWPEKLVEEATRVSEINLQNPVFKNIFENYPKNPDLPSVKSYYQLSSDYKNRAENLMELPGKKTFLAGYNSGRGKVYVSAVPLNEDFSNLPRHGLFIPILYRIALLSGHDLPLFYTLGSAEPIEIPPIQLTANQIPKLIKNGRAIIPGVKQQEGNSLLYVADQLQETGIYDLKKQDSLVVVLSFNDNRSESDLSYFTSAELAKLLPNSSQVIEAGNGLLKEEISDTNFGIQLWKLCIILALIFLAAEVLLVRYFKTGLRGVSGPV
jgi:Aerotolerance regulator N-terminal